MSTWCEEICRECFWPFCVGWRSEMRLSMAALFFE
jgi:hypothetical protein